MKSSVFAKKKYCWELSALAKKQTIYKHTFKNFNFVSNLIFFFVIIT